MNDPEDILRYWFADATVSPERAKNRVRFWYRSGPNTDREISERFGEAITAAASGQMSDWTEQPRSCLALIIVFDQFPRHVHRRTAAAFQHDADALAASEIAVASDYLEELAIIEQVFALVPFEHSEVLGHQRKGVQLFTELFDRAPEEWKPVVKNNLDYIYIHKAVIERFGRFPHRNSILGRIPTKAELEYLEQGGATFGQGPGRDA